MPVLYDAQGNPQEVAAEQVSDAIKSGQLGFKMGERVSVVLPDGTTGTVDAKDAPRQIVDMGARLQTDAEVKDRAVKNAYAGPVATGVAGVAGALRGVTGGFSDIGSAALGLGTVSREIKQAHETASTVGEIGGIAGSILGGGLVAGTAVEGLTGGVGALAKLGAGIEAKVGGAIAGKLGGGLAARTLAKTVGGAAGSAVEGAIYSTGQLISEEALAGKDGVPLTAERIASHIGYGTLLSGATGGVFSAGWSLAGAGIKGSTKLAASGVRKMYESAKGIKAHPKLESAYAKLSSAVSGADEGLIAKLTQKPFGKEGRAIREAATAGDDVRQAATKKVTTLHDILEDDFREVADEAIGVPKHGKFKTLIDGDFDTQARSVRQMIAETGESLNAMKTVSKSELGFQNHITKTRNAIESALDDIESAIKKRGVGNTADAAADLFIIADKVKRDIGKFRSMQKRASIGTDQATAGFFEDTYQAFKENLESVDLWGKAGSAQADINKAWTTLLSSNEVGIRFSAKVGTRDFKPVYKTNPKSIKKYIDTLTDTEMNLDHRYFVDKIANRQHWLDVAEEWLELDPSKLKAIKRARGNTAELQTAIDEISDKVVLQNQLKELVESDTKTGGIIGGLGGFAVGGIPGAVAGGVLGSVASPGKMVHRLAAMERMSANAGKKITEAIDAIVPKSVPGKAVGKAATTTVKGRVRKEQLKRLVAPTSVEILENTKYAPSEAKDEPAMKNEPRKIKAFRRRATELAKLATDPVSTHEQISRGLAGVSDAAPKITTQMATQAVKAAGFLHSKAPKDPMPNNTLTLSQKRWRPSDADISKWARYVRAADDPLSILDDIQAGRVSVEAVETLRELYPELHKSITTEIAERAGELQQTLPYEDRVQLSILFGVPVDPTMEPRFISQMQALYNQQEQPEAKPVKTANLSKLTIAERSQTAVQRLES